MFREQPYLAPGVSYDAEGNVVLRCALRWDSCEESGESSDGMETENAPIVRDRRGESAWERTIAGGEKQDSASHGIFSGVRNDSGAKQRTLTLESLSRAWIETSGVHPSAAESLAECSVPGPSDSSASSHLNQPELPARAGGEITTSASAEEELAVQEPENISPPPQESQQAAGKAGSLVPHVFAQSLGESMRFGMTFLVVFGLLFVGLNYSSFYQIGRATLMPEIDAAKREALQMVADPILRSELLHVPELPHAGDTAALPILQVIAPPDNRVVIPRLGKNIPLVEVTDASLLREDWKTFEKDIQEGLRFGVVRYPGTAVPGQVGNIFITGHSSFQPWDPGRYKDVFALLPTLDIGDEYSIYYNGRLHRYKINDKFEVRPSNVTVLDQPTNAYMSTLMTCVPVGTNISRLILRAHEVDPSTNEPLAVGGDLPPAIGDATQFNGELPI
jgi:LPXTG-site transpeptidase (sortase) family protein